MNKAIFFDKDGTLIHDVPYNVNPELIRFEKYVFESVKLLQQNGFLIVIISNQPGIGLGYFIESDLVRVKEKIENIFLQHEIMLNGFYFCPHTPAEECSCRKPKPGLILQAARDLNIILSESWMIGDILNDVEAGKRAGCKTILIDNGNETEWKRDSYRVPDRMVKDIKDAAEYILFS